MAAYVRSKGYRVKIIDAPAEKISVESFAGYLHENLENFQDCLNGQRFKGSVIKG